MELGKCPVCSKKIGYRTANRVFRWDMNLIQQVELIFKPLPDNAATTSVHVVLCKDCAGEFVFESVNDGMADEKNYSAFMAEFLEAEFVEMKFEGESNG